MSLRILSQSDYCPGQTAREKQYRGWFRYGLDREARCLPAKDVVCMVQEEAIESADGSVDQKQVYSSLT